MGGGGERHIEGGTLLGVRWKGAFCLETEGKRHSRDNWKGSVCWVKDERGHLIGNRWKGVSWWGTYGKMHIYIGGHMYG